MLFDTVAVIRKDKLNCGMGILSILSRDTEDGTITKHKKISGVLCESKSRIIAKCEPDSRISVWCDS